MHKPTKQSNDRCNPVPISGTYLDDNLCISQQQLKPSYFDRRPVTSGVYMSWDDDNDESIL